MADQRTEVFYATVTAGRVTKGMPPWGQALSNDEDLAGVGVSGIDPGRALTMDLQVSHLRTLQAIARHGSFSRAAQALNLTQPAVSMQVRHLEQALGLPLLERVGKRAFPTRAGELLLAHADRALRELEAGVERVQELRGVVAGRVRLGTSASISIYLLPPALRRFRARYPETEIVIVTGNAAEITRAMWPTRSTSAS